MAVSTLVVETGVGLPTANTYISLADANQYFDDRLHATVWTGAADGTKNAALLWATRLLDEQVQWNGVPSNEIPEEQALRWPRFGVLRIDGNDSIEINEIPTFLKEAEAELAMALISADRTTIPESPSSRQLTSVSVGSNVSVKWGDLIIKDILPPSVLSKIRFYGEIISEGFEVPLERV